MSAEPSTIDLLGLLANRRRRHILRIMATCGSLSADELAREIADGASCDYREVRVTLYHHHLPRLAAHGAIAYDPDRGAVKKGPAFAGIVETLDAVSEESREAP